MHVVLVQITVKPDAVAVFVEQTLENARMSRMEPGILQFDVLQQPDDPTKFVLIEVYRKPEDQELHRQTTHYLHWRDTVKDMMATDRVGTRYANLFPADEVWNARKV